MSIHTYGQPLLPGDSSQWTPSAGRNDEAVRWPTRTDLTGFTSWVSCTAAGLDDLWLLDSFSSYDMLSVSAIEVFGFLNAKNTSQVAPLIKFGGTVVEGTTQNGAGTGTWVSIFDTFTRPGGGSWTQSDFPNLQVGIRSKTIGGGSDTLKFANAYLDVVNTPRPAMVHDPLDVASISAPTPDPKRFLLGINLVADTVTWIEDPGNPDRITTFGPITLPGQLYPVWVTLGQQSVINHP